MYRFIVVSTLLAICLGKAIDEQISKLDERIVGGTATVITKYPHQVSIENYNQHFCGGSIISNDWVLTATHCLVKVQASALTVRVGSSYKEKGGSVHRVSKFVLHPNFQKGNLDYDIAVIKVSTPFQYSNAVQPITMTTVSPSTGTAVIVTGWGLLRDRGQSPSQLQQLQVNIVDHGKCVRILNEADVTDRMICAGGLPQGGKGSCKGDSGGPLVSNGKLVGIVSRGLPCAHPGLPDVYTDVAKLRSWVQSETQIA